jgi:hypothetical protein
MIALSNSDCYYPQLSSRPTNEHVLFRDTVEQY